LSGKYALIVRSATAQQIINKSSEAWKSFFSFKWLKREGKFPKHIKVSMLRHGKKNGKKDEDSRQERVLQGPGDTCTSLMVSN